MSALGDRPLVSVITPVYNGAAYLEGLIQSVVRQDYPHLEHLVIDDGSTDDGATRRILERHPHLRWWSRPNQGQYATLNEGLAAAHGAVVGFISADDEYLAPSAVSAALAHWRAHPAADGVYGRLLYIDAAGARRIAQPHLAGPWPMSWLKYLCFVPHSSLFIDREWLAQRQLQFDPALRFTGDWDWLIRLAAAGGRLSFLNRPLSFYRLQPAQMTQRHAAEIATEERLICQRYHIDYRRHRLALALAHAYDAALVGGATLVRQGPLVLARRVARRWKPRPPASA